MSHSQDNRRRRARARRRMGTWLVKHAITKHQLVHGFGEALFGELAADVDGVSVAFCREHRDGRARGYKHTRLYAAAPDVAHPPALT